MVISMENGIDLPVLNSGHSLNSYALEKGMNPLLFAGSELNNRYSET